MEQFQVEASVPVSVRQLNVGDILSQTMAVLLKKPALFLGLSAIAMLPSLLSEIFLTEKKYAYFSMNILSFVLYLVMQATFAYAVFHILLNRKVTMGEALNSGMSRIITIFLASILTGFGIFLGTMLFLIPGLILFTMWAVTIPACTVEKLSATASIRRSVELTKGHRWKIFSLAMFVGFLMYAVAAGVSFIIALITRDVTLATIIGTIASIVPQSFSCAMYAIIYYHIREIKEGITLNKLVEVFN